MDSSNSGSFQSSSGGGGAAAADTDHEFDSTTQSQSQSQSISSFFNNPASTNFNNQLNHLLQPYNHRPQPTHLYNPPTLIPPIQDPSSPWTQTLRPDPNHPPTFNAFKLNQLQNPTNLSSSSSMDTQAILKTGRGSDHQMGVTMKNPKKRTRASRRAPTTVLTTDTTNFRQMVQEFTGIPTAPFTTAPFTRRLDLFRPSAQKIQQQPPPFLNSTANNIIVESSTSSNNHNHNNNNNTTATSNSGNYHFTPSNITSFQKQPSTFPDVQNPMFSFQSLLQNSLPQQPNDLLKRWGDQNGKLEGFEGVIGNTQNIGGSKLNSGIENALGGGSGGDQVQVQVQGNEGSWICPSN